MPSRSSLSITEHADSAAMATAVAAELGMLIDAAIQLRDRAVIVLSGGRTPGAMHRALAAQPRDWTRVIALPGDERWVDADHPARNQRELAADFAAAAGLQLRGLAPERVNGPDTLAAEHSLRDLEAFDTVVLGMGLDGHTASLFPGGEGIEAAMDLQAKGDAFVVVPRPLPSEAPFPRITLGRRRLGAARRHLLLISGASKRALLERVLVERDPRLHPIASFLHPPLSLQVHWSP